jgi:hypothetical protein
MSASLPCSGSNCPSASRISSKNPRLMYTLCSSVIFFMMVWALAFFSQATVPNFMPGLMATRNGILLTFMTSTQRTTCRYCAMMVIGIGTRPPGRTWSDAVLTVLPFKDPRSGPKMSSALWMSYEITSQLMMRPLLASSRYLLVLGRPILRCIVWAFSARR